MVFSISNSSMFDDSENYLYFLYSSLLSSLCLSLMSIARWIQVNYTQYQFVPTSHIRPPSLSFPRIMFSLLLVFLSMWYVIRSSNCFWIRGLNYVFYPFSINSFHFLWFIAPTTAINSVWSMTNINYPSSHTIAHFLCTSIPLYAIWLSAINIVGNEIQKPNANIRYGHSSFPAALFG